MEKAFSTLQMGVNMKETLTMASDMEKAFSTLQWE